MIRPRKFRTTGARQRELVRKMYLGLITLVVLSLILAGLSYGSRHDSIRIQEVTVTTDGGLDVARIEAEVLREINGSYLFLIPKDIGVLVNPEHIGERLKDIFPRIADVHIEREGFQTLVGTVRERTPRVLWCGDIVPPLARTGGARAGNESYGVCYLVDKTGYIYDLAPEYSGNPFIRFYSSLDRAEPIGQYTTEGDVFTNVLEFLGRLAVPDQSVHSVLLADERDVEVYFDTGIRILLQNPLGSTVHMHINTLFTSDAFDHSRVLEQIDMRFGNKVFVKYQDGTSVDVSRRASEGRESTPIPAEE